MRFRKTDEEEFRPELTPLVDVVFQLIIFFMVSTVFIEFNQQMDIETPKVEGSLTQDQIKRLTIEITRDERAFLEGQELAVDEIHKHLPERSSVRSVVIRADKRLPYGIVMQIMQICKTAIYQRTYKVHCHRRHRVALYKTLRVRTSCFGSEINRIDQVATVTGQCFTFTCLYI